MEAVVAAVVTAVLGALCVPFFRNAAIERVILAKLKDEAEVVTALPPGDAKQALERLMSERVDLYRHHARPNGQSMVDVLLVGFVSMVVGLLALGGAYHLASDAEVSATTGAFILLCVGLVWIVVGVVVIAIATSDRAKSRRNGRKKKRA